MDLGQEQAAAETNWAGEVAGQAGSGGGRDPTHLQEQLLEAIPLPLLLKDTQGRYTGCNRAFLEYFRKTKEEVIGRTVFDIAPAELAKIHHAADQRLLAGGGPQLYEGPVRDPAGRSRHVQFHKATYSGTDGAIAGILGLMLDVTEQHEARTALARSEAELAAVYDHAPVMMFLLDENRRVRLVNRAGIEFAGKPMDQLVGRRVGELLGCIRAADSPQGGEDQADCTGCPLRLSVVDALETGGSRDRAVVQPTLVRGTQPRPFVLLASTTPVQVDGETRVLLCLEDITEQRKAEDRVREQAALLDIAHDAISVLDLKGVIQYWNQGAEQLYGWKAEEAVGRDIIALVFAKVCPEWAHAWRTVQQTGRWTGELTQANRSRNMLIVQARATLVRGSDGGSCSVLIVATDLTERKKYEAQFLRMQRLECLGALAGGVAHDLNNVLSPILISIDMLHPLLNRSEDHEVLALLQSSARRGAEMVKQLLLFGRGSEGKRTELNLTRLIHEIGRLIEETFPKSIRLTRQTPDDLWPVWGDSTQIHQVLLNLCVNARDAMPEGGQLSISARNITLGEAGARTNPEAKAGTHLLIEVSDSGTGIPASIVDRVFDPFFTTKAMGQGSGLGLSTVLGIVRSHGGWVQVETREGQGSTFQVYLPASPGDPGGTVYLTRQDIPQGQQELILVVEDEVAIRHVLERTLTRCGYRVLLAREGAEAIRLCTQRQGEIALVITDMMMPRMNGMDTIRALREIEPRMRFLAITGVFPQPGPLQPPSEPPVPFLLKPFTVQQLMLALHEILRPNAFPAATPEGPVHGRKGVRAPSR